MNKFKILFLLIASIVVDTAVSGQTTYIKTSEGNIVDTSTYANMKAEKIEKFKKIFPTK